MGQIGVVVSGSREVTPLLRELRLAAPDGAALPASDPGDYIEVAVRGDAGSEATRKYYLLGGPPEQDDPPGLWRIAVERKVHGQGGSRFLHKIEPGAVLTVSTPYRGFELDPRPAHRLLVAEGIGIAAIYPLVRRLAKLGQDFTLCHLGRDPLPYRAEIEALAGPRAHFPTGPEAVEPLIAALAYPAHIHVCGSSALNERVTAIALSQGISRFQIEAECFDPSPIVGPENFAFEVELRKSGEILEVPPDRSLLEVLMTGGRPVNFYCGRGDCGTCPLPVIEATGEIDHRDRFLKPEQRASTICVCVSRLKGGRLVLDA